jgi:antitoxin YefM
MTILTASEARANLYRLIDQTTESHEPITISGKRGNAVLISAEDWSAIQETLYLLAVPGMRESIKAGMAEPLAKSATSARLVSWQVVFARHADERCEEARCRGRPEIKSPRAACSTCQRSIPESAVPT